MMLFDGLDGGAETQDLGKGAVILRGFVREHVAAIVREVEQIAAVAPFRHMTTPGGYKMSIATTSCGELGWVSDVGGYRYSPIDPYRQEPWPPMPELFRELAPRAADAAGFTGFQPDACLINRYAPGAKLSLHQDRDERDF